MDSCRRQPFNGRTAISRVLLALVAVPLVLVGMLLMHVVTSDGAPAAAGGVLVSAQELHADAGVAVDPLPPQPTFEELVCILALLIGMLLLTLPALTSRLRDGPAGASVGLQNVASAQPRRPNLHVLSISRT